MDLGLEGKVAVVTGASLGLGAAIARRLATEGCRLVVLARGKEKLEALRSSLTGSHASEAIAICCDVRSRADTDAAIAEIFRQHQRVDILVNNAGNLSTKTFEEFEDLTDDDFVNTFVLNTVSAARFCRAVLPGMKAAGWGRIINMSSESAVQPDPIGADYSAAKAALTALTKSLSKRYGGDGIVCNTVAPALVMTENVRAVIEGIASANAMSFEEAKKAFVSGFRPNIVVGRPGMPEEVAATVAFLASEHAAFITGSNVRVDGGSVAAMFG